MLSEASRLEMQRPFASLRVTGCKIIHLNMIMGNCFDNVTLNTDLTLTYMGIAKQSCLMLSVPTLRL